MPQSFPVACNEETTSLNVLCLFAYSFCLETPVQCMPIATVDMTTLGKTISLPNLAGEHKRLSLDGSSTPK